MLVLSMWSSTTAGGSGGLCYWSIDRRSRRGRSRVRRRRRRSGIEG
jgi:hypothetical protein